MVPDHLPAVRRRNEPMLTLVASFFWGTVGFAMIVYGKKSGELFPAIIGAVLIVLSYFLSALWLTLAAVSLIVVLWLHHRGNI